MRPNIPPIEQQLSSSAIAGIEFAFCIRGMIMRYASSAVCTSDGPLRTRRRNHEETAQSGMVRAGRPGWLRISELDEESGLAFRPFRWPPPHRYLQHLVRVDAMQRSLSRDRGV